METLETQSVGDGFTARLHYDPCGIDADPRTSQTNATVFLGGYAGDSAGMHVPDAPASWASRWGIDYEAQLTTMRELFAEGAYVVAEADYVEGQGYTLGKIHRYRPANVDAIEGSRALIYVAAGNECGTPREYAEDVIRQDVAEYDAWVRGEVYGFTVTDRDGAEVDSCWGFVGDMGYCFSEAVESAKYHRGAWRRKCLFRGLEQVGGMAVAA